MLPAGRRANDLSDYRDIYHEYGIIPKMLDQEADPMFCIDDWACSDANSAKAYHYLSSLDLFGDEYARVCGQVILLFWKTLTRQVIISVWCRRIRSPPACYKLD